MEFNGDASSVVEFCAVNAETRVRFPASPQYQYRRRLMVRTLDFQSGDGGSTPLGDTKIMIFAIIFLDEMIIVSISMEKWQSGRLRYLGKVEAHASGSMGSSPSLSATAVLDTV